MKSARKSGGVGVPVLRVSLKSWARFAARLSVVAFFLSASALARPSKTSAIDDFCLAIRNEFVEAVPQYFSGPDPWVQLDRLPNSFADVAVATVYYEGARIKWVVLEMEGPGNAWFETTHYFFDEDGRIKKRERHLDQYLSHIRIREDQYFDAQRIIKTGFHHSRLTENSSVSADKPGANENPAPSACSSCANSPKENWDSFFDPNAPFYTSTADLPDLFLKAESKHLAGLNSRFLFGSALIPAKIQPSGHFMR